MPVYLNIMKATEGQKYVTNLFFGGLAADIDPDMLDPKTGSILEAHCMHVSNKFRNILRKLPGEKTFVEFTSLGNLVYIGAIWFIGYVVEFWYDIATHEVSIYANGLLIAQSKDLPGDPTHFLDIDSCDETGEMFITDNKQCPIVLDLPDMISSTATTIYFANYDKSLYEINRPVAFSQPVFQKLEDMGVEGG